MQKITKIKGKKCYIMLLMMMMTIEIERHCAIQKFDPSLNIFTLILKLLIDVRLTLSTKLKGVMVEMVIFDGEMTLI